MHPMHVRVLRSWLVGAGLFAVACVGRLEEEDRTGGGGGTRGAPSACTGTIDPGPTPLRRLNRFEYDNTVVDLLFGGPRPAGTFPSEEKVNGFDNNGEALTVSPLLSEQYMLAAERLASDYLDRDLANLPRRYACNGSSDVSSPAGEDACAKNVFQALGKRAYRRPVQADEIQVLLDVYAAGKTSAAQVGASGFRNGLRLGLMAILQSPRFLYRVETGVAPENGARVTRLDPYETAVRLSYLLWGAQPDGPLLTAADENRLGTREEIAAQVGRMLMDPRARALVKRFHRQWLQTDRIDDLDKDTKVFKTWKPDFIGPMRQETEKFMDYTVWEAEGTLTALFTAPYTFVEQTLAAFYGFKNYVSPMKNGMSSGEIARVDLDGTATRRAGFLTQGTFMASLAGPNQTSPVKRGQFVRERLLCQSLPPPPPDVVVELPPLDAAQTTRERFAKHDSIDACKGCHLLMDPIGLGFETFDGVGVLRLKEAGRDIDASGEVAGVPWDGRFDGPLDLATKLAASAEAQDCYLRSWFRFGYGRTEVDQVDACSLETARKQFQAGNLGVKDLLAALVTTDAFLYKRLDTAGGAP